MKLFKELKHVLGLDSEGKRAWVNPKETRTVSMEDNHANDLNSQFENSGIKYEPVAQAGVNYSGGHEVKLEGSIENFGNASSIIPESENKTQDATPLTKDDLIPDSEKTGGHDNAMLTTSGDSIPKGQGQGALTDEEKSAIEKLGKLMSEPLPDSIKEALWQNAGDSITESEKTGGATSESQPQ